MNRQDAKVAKELKSSESIDKWYKNASESGTVSDDVV
jgi:hypothetical protein